MKLPKKLRSLVKKSVAILGELLKRELGPAGFQQIEHIRFAMSKTHKLSEAETLSHLKNYYKKLEMLKPQDQHNIAQAFTLMLELINVCENAYRSHRINSENQIKSNTTKLPEAIIYVFTAHPTEARSPQNIAIFYEIQNVLIAALNRTELSQNKSEIIFSVQEHNALLHSLEIAWRTSITRSRTPKVKDEAEHIYSLIFRNEILLSLLEKREDKVSFYIRSWVGADKDGHPGVNENTLLQSLRLSRKKILQLIYQELMQVRKTLKTISLSKLQKKISPLEKMISQLKILKTADAKTVRTFVIALASFTTDYEKIIGARHPSLNRLKCIIHAFPALVVPLELRESSEVLMSEAKFQKKLPIYKMLELIEKISRGGNPRFYVRGFIISMTNSVEHLLMAANFQKNIFKNIPLPIIPLFEEFQTLVNSNKIMSEFVKNKEIKKAALKCWSQQIEMMVGYSDSAKECGVLASRLAISNALPKLEKTCKQAGFIPIFFHGSGGSIDRGGGSIEDQTAWWPKSSLRFYKVTVQGEMIERSLATAAIAKRQINKIIENSARALERPFNYQKNKTVELFAKDASEKYQTDIASEEFLKLVEFATPYPFLNILKIGSRPTKRILQPTVKGLRAIPWVMCWTQTRVLFPTWWGIGTSWKNSSRAQKAELKKAFQKDPVFTSYVKALGFTLAKIELNIWKIYLEHSGLSKLQIENASKEFQIEFKLTLKFYFAVCKQKDLLWFRPWLGESINLRSPMIHPLNLLQIIAKKNNDLKLLRITTTGISNGMLTTG